MPFHLDQRPNFPISLLFLFFLGIILYLNNAWIEGMFFDGHLYMALGKNAAEKGYWPIPHLSKSTYAEFSTHLPFIFILEGLFFKIFGSSYTAGRIFSSIFSLGSFIVLYLWASKKSKTLAFWSSFFFLIIPPLIKKTRIVGLDTPLMFFCLLSAYLTFLYLKEKKMKFALGSGIAWGCALLTKGPIALFVPLGIFLYLLTTRKKHAFLDIKIYIIPLIGIILLGIWPFSLWTMGKFEIVEKYFISTFIHTAIEGRSEPAKSFFFYIVYLIKQTFFILPLALLGIWTVWKEKSGLGRYACALLLALIIPMSLMNFKYSHYIIPLYPYLALLAGKGLVEYTPKTWLLQFENKIFPFLAIFVFSVLNIFPINNRSNRNPQLQKIISLIDGMDSVPKQWALVNQVYPFYDVANLMAYRYGAEVFNVDQSISQKILKGEEVSHLVESDWPLKLDPQKWVLLVKVQDWEERMLKNNFKIIAYFKRGDFFFVAHQSLLKNSLLHFP